ncbi:MAG: 6-phosphogluconolactonase [Candidatus Nanopelagicales bacterium]
MSAVQIGVHPDAEGVSRAVANRMAGAIVRTLATQDLAHICITGGRGGHGALSSLAADTGIDWRRVHVWWSDERFLPSGDDERNDTMARAALLDRVDVPSANVHSMPASDQVPDVARGAESYVAELAAFGHPCPAFCVSILGMGEDGHVASLFPEHPGLRDTRPAFPVLDSPKPPPVRISMSFEVINAADEVVLIASGAGKADAVGLLVNDPGPLAVPAAGAHGRSLTFLAVDEAAAAHLPPGLQRYR